MPAQWLAVCTVLLLAAFATWLVSLAQRNVTIVDTLWPLMFVIGAAVYAVTAPAVGPRALLVLALVSIWGLRLAAHLALRNHGRPEDRRYQAIRARNEPNFAFKSLYLVFGLQALLAAVVSLPLLGAISGSTPLGPLDAAGVVLWTVGLLFESVGDWQLARFKSNPGNANRVMDRGLWGWTRHPNYFGDFCVWWGFYLIAAAAGAWWSIAGPALMSVLLMRVSGVALLEQDIGERRPGYRDYIRRVNAFFPGPPRR
jgi:steroid 5-alpha reductase family enzyme